MSDQKKDMVRPVEADGIKEFDNQLPRWWVWLFYLSIAYAAGLLIYMQLMGGKTLIQKYNEDLEANLALQKSGSPQTPSGDQPAINLDELMESEDTIAKGKEIYDVNCFPCHAADGGGTIGPNLTDNYWIHGGKPENIIAVVTNGVPDKGMIAWQPILGQEKVTQVSAYVLSLKGTTPLNPKAPDGVLEEAQDSEPSDNMDKEAEDNEELEESGE
jgi:cytochrome c oxidase cbb3-type subunit 3